MDKKTNLKDVDTGLDQTKNTYELRPNGVSKNESKNKKNVKVEFKNKSGRGKIIVNSFISWVISLYILGALVVVSGYATTFIYQTVVSRILEFVFSYEMSTFITIISNPIIIVVSMLLIIPALSFYGILKYSIVKLGVFHSDFEEKAFNLISFVILIFSAAAYF